MHSELKSINLSQLLQSILKLHMDEKKPLIVLCQVSRD